MANDRRFDVNDVQKSNLSQRTFKFSGRRPIDSSYRKTVARRSVAIFGSPVKDVGFAEEVLVLR